jgi:hypothetical protein
MGYWSDDEREILYATGRPRGPRVDRAQNMVKGRNPGTAQVGAQALQLDRALPRRRG